MKNLIRPRNAVCLLVLGAVALPGLAIADHLNFEARLTGKQEVSEQNTTGNGAIQIIFNQAYRFVDVVVKFNRLEGELTGAHFHCARAGENGPVAFGLVGPGPLGAEGNTIIGRLRNSDYSGADCLNAVGRTINNIASLAFAMREGLIYLNIHSSAFPGGEIRGQIVEAHDDPGAN